MIAQGKTGRYAPHKSESIYHKGTTLTKVCLCIYPHVPFFLVMALFTTFHLYQNSLLTQLTGQGLAIGHCLWWSYGWIQSSHCCSLTSSLLAWNQNLLQVAAGKATPRSVIIGTFRFLYILKELIATMLGLPCWSSG